MDSYQQFCPIPSLFTSLPLIRDSLETESSIALDSALQECLPLLTGTEAEEELPVVFSAHGVPRLEREKHIAYLHKSLGKLPSAFVMADASRPWMLYWALSGLHLLGEDVSQYRERLLSYLNLARFFVAGFYALSITLHFRTGLIETVRVISTLSPMQNLEGGFGGGHGQTSHSAASYAAILALILVGGEDALSVTDRKSLWKWLGHLKQKDGGFSLCIGGEEDVRGAYCAMVLIALLNLPIELPSTSAANVSGHDTFLTDLPQYLARCQTYEGGISGSPGTEAHGAYAFCALACLCIFGEPRAMLGEYLDLPSLISWLSARQYAPEGGFAGRTNKLVDGCYSHWVGGCWPLIEAAIDRRPTSTSDPQMPKGSLYSREGLIRYILCCCQAPHGGLRDKPEKHPDSYHSCYVLAGLSSAQHLHHCQTSQALGPSQSTSAAFLWSTPRAANGGGSAGGEDAIFDDDDLVGKVHPIFVLPWGLSEDTRAFFERKIGFSR